jgi:hypothetical protein
VATITADRNVRMDSTSSSSQQQQQDSEQQQQQDSEQQQQQPQVSPVQCDPIQLSIFSHR